LDKNIVATIARECKLEGKKKHKYLKKCLKRRIKRNTKGSLFGALASTRKKPEGFCPGLLDRQHGLVVAE